MQHLVIGVYIITFIAGFISIYYVSNQYKIYKYSFFKSYVFHILCINLIVLSSIASRYYKTNLFGSVGSTDLIKAHFIMDILFLMQKGIELFVTLGIAYTLVKIVLQIQEKEIPRKLHFMFILLLAVSAFVYGGSTVNFLNTNDSHWVFLSYDIISNIIAVFIICFLIYTVIKNRSLIKDGKRKITGVFSGFYLICILVLIILNIPDISYQILFTAVIFLVFNIFPIFWVRYIHSTYSQHFFAVPNNMVNIDRLVSEYNISEREREILELILKGYTNKEIRQQLFLSVHTVKNHNYNLYKKLGVSSRGELLRMTMNPG